MFYYIASKKPKLEVRIVDSYTEADLERVFLFIDALIDSPKMKVVFKVHPSCNELFKKTIQKLDWNPLYPYNIKENVA